MMSTYKEEVRAFARSVSLRLLAWSGLSIAGGALLWWRGGPFARAFGVQALAWGAIDALIAAFGLLGGRRAPAAGELAETSAVAGATAEREAQKLRRLLWFNALLDVGYVTGGVALLRTKGRSDPQWRGHGWGIIVQGAFLFVFDLVHALRVPRQQSP
jgi:hypothetical protein